MRIDVLTLFPEAIEPFTNASIIGRAQRAGIVTIRYTNIRDFAADRHRSVDDRPFGGGPGMVMMCPPVFDAVESVEGRPIQGIPAAEETAKATPLTAEKGPDAERQASTRGERAEWPQAADAENKAADAHPARPTRVLLTPQGEPFNQTMAAELAREPWLLVICGHYEGFDERIIQGLAPREISVGDYVLSGGEAAAMVLIDGIVRLLPGAVGDQESIASESFAEGLLEYPHYTRPRCYRGMEVPEVLLSGDHARIRQWRHEQSEHRTHRRRPDLLAEGPSDES